MRNLSAKEIYEDSAARGLYEEAGFDADEIKKVLHMALEYFAFSRKIKVEKNPSWRVVYNAYYDVFRELCDLLLRFRKQKSGNHQAVFAFMVVYFKELDFDWPLLEQIRTTRNNNKYQGLDISRNMWKSIEMPLEVYIASLQKEIERRLQE